MHIETRRTWFTARRYNPTGGITASTAYKQKTSVAFPQISGHCIRNQQLWYNSHFRKEQHLPEPHIKSWLVKMQQPPGFLIGAVSRK